MIAGLRTAGRVIARVCVALAFCIAVVFVPSVASWAAVPPYPATGGTASTWKCTDTATADTPPVTGSTCAVTAWEADPPAPEAGPAPSSSTVALTDTQFETITFGLGLVLLVGGARLVGGWAR